MGEHMNREDRAGKHLTIRSLAASSRLKGFVLVLFAFSLMCSSNINAQTVVDGGLSAPAVPATLGPEHSHQRELRSGHSPLDQPRGMLRD
jgi:hypothetical protein